MTAVIAAVFASKACKDGGGFSWQLSEPDNRLQYDIAGTLGNGNLGLHRRHP
jgi:hypothetical protein